MLSEAEVLAKWSNPELKNLSVATIEDPEKRLATARLLENIEGYYAPKDMFGDLLTETLPTTVAPTSQATGQFQPIAMAMGRRVMPALFAWNIAGIQPMSGPVGLAYAMRFKYNGFPHEAAFDDVDLFSTFTGNLSGTSGTADAGTRVSTATAEAWEIFGTTNPMPQLTYSMERVAIEAQTRKLAATVTMETLQDVKAMHGIDVKKELVVKLDYQVRAELDREVLQACKTQAVNTSNGGETVTTFQTSAADGRWSQEKYANVAAVINKKSNDIRISTRINSANVMVVSPRVATVLQQCQPFFTALQSNINAGGAAVAELGTFASSMKVYIDSYARSDYALLGFKGADGQNECGVILSPYVMGLQAEATDPANFSTRVGVMSRMAITNSLMGSGRYYRQINFVGLSNILQA